ncbi:hypothetical protein BS17DRAFT_818470 [Gyrodon lividus]|nr:hypothetical protein BS17DRAFT_818470 [Gyrodon lividus]
MSAFAALFASFHVAVPPHTGDKYLYERPLVDIAFSHLKIRRMERLELWKPRKQRAACDLGTELAPVPPLFGCELE